MNKLTLRNLYIKSVIVSLLVLFNGALGYAADHKDDTGIPGVLRYAKKYGSDETTTENKKESNDKSFSMVSRVSSDNDLKRRLLLREQELRRLRGENKNLSRQLNERINFTSDKNRSPEIIDSLKKELATSQIKNNELNEKLNSLVTELNISKKNQNELTEKTAAQKKSYDEKIKYLKEELNKMPLVKLSSSASEKTSQIYAKGVDIGRDISMFLEGQKKMGLEQDIRIFFSGIWDVMNNQVQINAHDLTTALEQADAKEQKARLSVIKQQKNAGQMYVKKFLKNRNVKKSDLGFWYLIDYTGDGSFISGEDTIVDIVVTEKLIDGTIVEDMDTKGRVLSQSLKHYPPVFRSAIELLKNHGSMELVVPSDLAYGDEGHLPKILPGATIIYKLRIENVVSKQNN
ncbi:FKBP-type peptidyl-prolyl cis-trans isomerase [Citrobacter freundii]|nr:FKBP-type peptidyl-prolyl cis-trans isomerase [Citrobacter freundii]